MNIQIVVEDSDLLIVNKPYGLQVEPDIKGNSNLLDEVKAFIQWPSQKDLFLVNRLDRPTSGLVVLAKKKSMLNILQSVWSQQKVTKKYLAVVEGNIVPDLKRVRHFLYKDTAQFKSIVSENKLNRFYKECILDYKFLKNQHNLSLLEVQLLTGRYHQIRAQFGFLGHPIWNDTLYGGVQVSKEVCIGLHSYSLEINLPTAQKPIQCKIMPSLHPAFQSFLGE